MRPVGIGETLRQALAKLVMRSAGEQEKMAYGNLQLFAGPKSHIEGTTHIVRQKRLERARSKQREEEAEASDVEEETEGVAALICNLRIETAETEEEAAECLEATLNMEMEVVWNINVEGEEGDDGTQRDMGDSDFLTHDEEPSGTTLIDARNGFNNLSRLTMLWTVRYC